MKGCLIIRSLLLMSCFVFASAAIGFPQTDPYAPGAPASGTFNSTGTPTHETDTPSDRVGSQTEGGKQIEFKAQTVLVEVPVIVTDASGAHIHQLAKTDFKMLDDGKSQHIVDFEEILPNKQVVSPLANSAGTFTNVTTDSHQTHSIIVIVLDEVNTPFLSQASARQQLIKYLGEHLDASQPVGLMVIGNKGARVLSGLDSNPETLIAALKKAGGSVSQMEKFSNDAQTVAATGETHSGLTPGGIGRHTPPEVAIRRFVMKEDNVEAPYVQARAIESTLSSFLSIAMSLSGLPGRKSVIWVTGGFPFYLDSFTSVPGDPGLRVLYERLMKAFNDEQVAVYPVDARGILSDPAFAGEFTGSMLGSEAQGFSDRSKNDSLKNFAKMTGGVAYSGTNDVAGAVALAMQDSSSYYLLSYYVDRRNTQPGWRKLLVEVNRKDAKVRARAGYLLTNVAANPELTHKADVGFALSSPFESTGVRITEHWLKVQGSGNKKNVGFALQVPAEDLIDEADKNRFDVDVVALATSKGATAGTFGQTIKGAVTPENLAKLKNDGVYYQNALNLPPGDYEVRFIVRDNLSGRIGSVIVPLTVN